MSLETSQEASSYHQRYIITYQSILGPPGAPYPPQNSRGWADKSRVLGKTYNRLSYGSKYEDTIEFYFSRTPLPPQKV